VNYLHDECLGGLQQFGESQIVIAERMIVLVYVLAKDGVYAWISLDDQAAPAARLLRWDRPLPLVDLLVLTLPAGILPSAPIHAALPPDRSSRLLGLVNNKLYCLVGLLGSKPSEKLIVIRPFPCHLAVVCNAPTLGSQGARGLLLLARIGEGIFGSRRAGGNIEVWHCEGIRKRFVYLPPPKRSPPPPTPVKSTVHGTHYLHLFTLYLRVIYSLIRLLILYSKYNL
jgi:hypothetical protein